jgi:quercetin dioxygenase-like cupin family protein
MKHILFLFLISLFPGLFLAGQDNLVSSVYDWQALPVEKSSSGELRHILKSPTRSLKEFDIKAITLAPDKSIDCLVEKGTDLLCIIKEGILEMQANRQKNILGEGSIIVVSPEDEFSVTNHSGNNATFYAIVFKPYPGNANNMKKVPPLIVNWENTEFKPSANGGRRFIMQQPTSCLKELEIHVTTLKEGLQSHAPHTHPDEEIILMRKGTGEETISGKAFRAGAGSVIFLTNDDLHGIGNAGKGECEYYAIRWLTGDL